MKKGTTKEVAVIPNLESQVIEETSKRKILAGYVKDNMVSGTDFYTLKIGGRETKPSLSKPGSEKVLSLFHWRAEFTKDGETHEMLGNPVGVLCYICKLFTIKDNLLVGEGRGARDSKKDNGDINKAIKMAEKSAQIDAVLRTGGLSDLFTQDVEDMEDIQPLESKVSDELRKQIINTTNEADLKALWEANKGLGKEFASLVTNQKKFIQEVAASEKDIV